MVPRTVRISRSTSRACRALPSRPAWPHARRRDCTQALRGVDDPTLLIENKLLYRERAMQRCPRAIHARVGALLPTTVLRPADQPDITIVAFGRMSGLAEQSRVALAERTSIASELLFPLSVSPFDTEPIRESVARTGNLLVVEEGAEGFDLAAKSLPAWRSAYRGTRRCACGAWPRKRCRSRAPSLSSASSAERCDALRRLPGALR